MKNLNLWLCLLHYGSGKFMGFDEVLKKDKRASETQKTLSDVRSGKREVISLF